MKKINTILFDNKRTPPKQNLFFTPFIWLLCWFWTKRYGLKIHKKNMKGLKPPYLVLGTHHSFMDFCVTPLTLFPHRANYVSELEGFEAYGEWFYRQLGCLGTRKFINDIHLVKNIQKVMKRNGILVLYPEARYANVGTSSDLPVSVGKLIKLLKVPVVIVNMHGNYLQSPIWNLTYRKEAKLEATITQVLTADDVLNSSAEEILHTVKQHLSYDEYTWQAEKQMKITFKERAKGLHLPLYQCPVCKTEFSMQSKDEILSCSHCGEAWEMDFYGKLKRLMHTDMINTDFVNNFINTESDNNFTNIDFDNYFSHIPNWYEWERHQVEKEIDESHYSLNCKVRIESLPNAVNFIDCGTGNLKHSNDGFYLTFQDYGQSEEQTLFFSSKSLFSIHTEYDYRKKGQCITLSTNDNTYFLFPLEDGFNATKIQFATEYLYKLSQKTSPVCSRRSKTC